MIYLFIVFFFFVITRGSLKLFTALTLLQFMTYTVIYSGLET